MLCDGGYDGCVMKFLEFKSAGFNFWKGKSFWAIIVFLDVEILNQNCFDFEGCS